MNKILSFVIPAYNAAQFLDKCILSLVNEEVFDKLDIIIVNDGSTDNTMEAAQKYCDKYPGTIKMINQENKGHGGALNTGCAAAAGKYLKVIDADDWVETQNLPDFVRLLKECESDVVLTHHYTINISTDEVKKWKSYPREFGRAYSFDEIMLNWKSFDRSLTFHGITYNTEFYHKNAIQLSEHVFYEDHEFAAIPCCYARSITPFDLFIYDYRIGDVRQSVSDENQLRKISNTEAVLKRFMKEYKTIKLDENSVGGRAYYCRKAQGLLLSYITTVMLVEKKRKRGRELGDQRMARFQRDMPMTFVMAKKQYQIFRLMNKFHISKNTWEMILSSKAYKMIQKKHDFD